MLRFTMSESIIEKNCSSRLTNVECVGYSYSLRFILKSSVAMNILYLKYVKVWPGRKVMSGPDDMYARKIGVALTMKLRGHMLIRDLVGSGVIIAIGIPSRFDIAIGFTSPRLPPKTQIFDTVGFLTNSSSDQGKIVLNLTQDHPPLLPDELS